MIGSHRAFPLIAMRTLHALTIKSVKSERNGEKQKYWKKNANKFKVGDPR